MRYLILGAGAIGGAIGGRLFQHGHDVVLIARGAHLEAIRSGGLELRDPEATVRLPIQAVATAEAAELRPDDVVILATKTQHSEALLADLAVVGPAGHRRRLCPERRRERAPGSTALRQHLRHAGRSSPAPILEPGVVDISTAPVWGILDVGRYPSGSDELAERIADDLRGSGFDARATPESWGTST